MAGMFLPAGTAPSSPTRIHACAGQCGRQRQTRTRRVSQIPNPRSRPCLRGLCTLRKESLHGISRGALFSTVSAFAHRGPERKTLEIGTLGFGVDERNAVWANSRRRLLCRVRRPNRLDDSMRESASRSAAGRLYGYPLQGFSRCQSCASDAALRRPIAPRQSHMVRANAVQTATVRRRGAGSWTG